MGTTVLEGRSLTLNTLIYLFRGYRCGLSSRRVEFYSVTCTRGHASSCLKCLLCFSNSHVYVRWAKLWSELNRGLRVMRLNALWKGKPLIYDVFVAITTEKVSDSPDWSPLVCSTYKHGLVSSVLVSVLTTSCCLMWKSDFFFLSIWCLTTTITVISDCEYSPQPPWMCPSCYNLSLCYFKWVYMILRWSWRVWKPIESNILSILSQTA